MAGCRLASPYSGPLLGRWSFTAGKRQDSVIVEQVTFGDHSWFMTDQIEFYGDGTVSSLADRCKFWPESVGVLRMDCGQGDGLIRYRFDGPAVTFYSDGGWSVTYKRM